MKDTHSRAIMVSEGLILATLHSYLGIRDDSFSLSDIRS